MAADGIDDDIDMSFDCVQACMQNGYFRRESSDNQRLAVMRREHAAKSQRDRDSNATDVRKRDRAHGARCGAN